MSENKGHESDKGWNISSVDFEKWMKWIYGWYLSVCKPNYILNFQINGMKFVEI